MEIIMRIRRHISYVIPLIFGFVVFFMPFWCSAQSTSRAEDDCSVITYLQGKTIKLPFVPSRRFSGSIGTGEVKLSDQGEAEIKVKFERLPSVHDIGGRFSTYVLWMVMPDGSTTSIGSLNINGEDKLYSDEFSAKRTIPEFGLLLTVEPHYLVETPGVVVLRSAKPIGALASEREVRCRFSENDYYRTQPKLTEKEKKAIRKKPLSIFAAEYALELAGAAGAETMADDEYGKAEVALRELKELWQRKGNKDEINRNANKVIGLAANAEKLARTKIREGREAKEIQRKNDDIEDLREQLRSANKSIESLTAQAERSMSDYKTIAAEYQQKRGQMENQDQLNRKLTEEVTQLRNENTDLRLKVRGLETDLIRARGAKEWIKESPILEKHLAVFGKVQKRDDGLVLVLDESRWELPEEGKLSATSLIELDPLFSKIAEAKYLEIQISSFVAVAESSAQAKVIGDKRATTIYQQLFNKGVRGDRMRNETFLQVPDNTPNSKKVPKPNPTRIEIFVRPLGDN